MSESLQIHKWTSSESNLQQLRDIFFLTSSRKTFADTTERNRFFETWTSYYLKNESSRIWCAYSGTQLVGYIMGCRDSAVSEELQKKLPSLVVFADQFSQYPSHLHINVHPLQQGKGLGHQLIEKLEEQLVNEGSLGLHLITSPEADNVRFYKKLGFDFTIQRNWKNHSLLFMGKRFKH